MNLKVVLYESKEGFTAFCPGLNGCITEGDTVDEALSNAGIAIREYMEAAWIEAREEIEQDSQDVAIVGVTYHDVEVDLEGVEEAEAEEIVQTT